MTAPAPETPSDSDNGPTLLNRQRRVKLSIPPLQDFLRRLQREVAAGSPVIVCLVSDAVMRRYQKRFRGLNQPTDVLSFPDGAAGRAGDLLVSVETARLQARRLGHSVETEIRILLLHGLLHLLGFDHEAPRDAARMARAERRWRKRLALPQGLMERVHQ